MNDAKTIEPSVRMLTMLPNADSPFWTSGREGTLKLLRNRSSGRWFHPMSDEGANDPDVEPAAVSGNGRIFTFTVNEHAYNPAVKPPYVIALVQLDEQEDLRIPTNIVGCTPDEIEVGMAVRVAFEPHGDVFVPVFELAR